MTKADLAREMSKITEFTMKKSTKAIDGIVAAIEEGVRVDGEVKIVGFGAWVKRVRAEHEGVNPKTRERITIPATATVGFKASKNLKEAVATEVE
jgi:DNA-binding protein HU-beta